MAAVLNLYSEKEAPEPFPRQGKQQANPTTIGASLPQALHFSSLLDTSFVFRHIP